jgi:hypothetical protein
MNELVQILIDPFCPNINQASLALLDHFTYSRGAGTLTSVKLRHSSGNLVKNEWGNPHQVDATLTERQIEGRNIWRRLLKPKYGLVGGGVSNE